MYFQLKIETKEQTFQTTQTPLGIQLSLCGGCLYSDGRPQNVALPNATAVVRRRVGHEILYWTAE